MLHTVHNLTQYSMLIYSNIMLHCQKIYLFIHLKTDKNTIKPRKNSNPTNKRWKEFSFFWEIMHNLIFSIPLNFFFIILAIHQSCKNHNRFFSESDLNDKFVNKTNKQLQYGKSTKEKKTTETFATLVGLSLL